MLSELFVIKYKIHATFNSYPIKYYTNRWISRSLKCSGPFLHILNLMTTVNKIVINYY